MCACAEGGHVRGSVWVVNIIVLLGAIFIFFIVAMLRLRLLFILHSLTTIGRVNRASRGNEEGRADPSDEEMDGHGELSCLSNEWEVMKKY